MELIELELYDPVENDRFSTKYVNPLVIQMIGPADRNFVEGDYSVVTINGKNYIVKKNAHFLAGQVDKAMASHPPATPAEGNA